MERVYDLLSRSPNRNPNTQTTRVTDRQTDRLTDNQTTGDMAIKHRKGHSTVGISFASGKY